MQRIPKAGGQPAAAEDAFGSVSEDRVNLRQRPRTQWIADPTARVLLTAVLVVVALTLLTVAYALLTGVFGSGAPRTLAEQRVVAAAAKVDAGSKDPADWKTYILALIDSGQYRKAQEWIKRGTAVLPDQDISADMLYMQADLYLAQGENVKALETASAALKTIKDTFESEKAKSAQSDQPSKAVAFGISENYWELLLLKAEVFEADGDWDQALLAYDEYLADQKNAATVFTQRGKVKEHLGDTAGAEADYRQTLVYISDDTEALAGLKRIGVSK